MKFSIITVCYNAAATIADSLRSVAEQSYPDVEHIVIDGASTDNTLEIVNANAKQIKTLISEPDTGIYDAMNKGLSLATGDIVGFLNADDFYASNAVLEKVADCFRGSDVDVVYGDLCYVKRQQPEEIVRYWRSSEYGQGKFERGWAPPHPTFFLRRWVYQQPQGHYDTSFRLAADFELILRCLAVQNLHSCYLSEVLVNMRLGGETNQSFSNIVRQNREILRAFRTNGLEVNMVRFAMGKLLSRARQFLTRPQA